MLRLQDTVCLLVIPKGVREAAGREQAVAMWNLEPSALQLRRHALCRLTVGAQAKHVQLGGDGLSCLCFLA